MKCDFEYCIYNKGFKCVLKRVGINSLAMCEECIMVSLADEIVEGAKEKQLENIIKKNL